MKRGPRTPDWSVNSMRAGILFGFTRNYGPSAKNGAWHIIDTKYILYLRNKLLESPVTYYFLGLFYWFCFVPLSQLPSGPSTDRPEELDWLYSQSEPPIQDIRRHAWGRRVRISWNMSKLYDFLLTWLKKVYIFGRVWTQSCFPCNLPPDINVGGVFASS